MQFTLETDTARITQQGPNSKVQRALFKVKALTRLYRGKGKGERTTEEMDDTVRPTRTAHARGISVTTLTNRPKHPEQLSLCGK